MSASSVIDIGGSAQAVQSFPSLAVAADGPIAITSGGVISSLSGVMIGDTVDMVHSDSYCNVMLAGVSTGSGPLMIGIQTSDATTSGTFTDPTSGLPSTAFPRGISSGGFIILGSGPATDTRLGIFGSGQSGQFIQSGFIAFAAFQRPQRYARLFLGSGFYEGPLQGGFVSKFSTTGSGGGFSLAPTSGSVNV